MQLLIQEERGPSVVTNLLVLLFSLQLSNASVALKPVEVSEEKSPLKIEKIFQGKDVIWSLEFISDSEILLTEKSGKIFKLNLGSLVKEEVKHSLPVAVYGQGGLLDIKKSPDFFKTQQVFISTAIRAGSEKYTTAVYSARLNNNELQGIKKIFESNTPTDEGQHFGCRITFDEKGHLFFAIGDRGQRDDAQNLKSHSGKVIRLKLSGEVPKDNPFVNQKNADPAVWSYGHRNPQGIFYDIKTKQLYLSEHGPRGGDEINIIEPGKNYGWPVVTYGREYWGPKIGEGVSKKGVEPPFVYFVPSIAPSSLIVYQKSDRPWSGDLLQGALVKEHLNRIHLNESRKPVLEERHFSDLDERVRALVEAPNGDILFSTDSGKIFKAKWSQSN